VNETGILDYFEHCTVAVLRNTQIRGTGFFAAPGYVVTCAHVVDGIQGRVEIRQGKTTSLASVAAIGNPRSLLEPRPGDSPHPDLAVLRLDNDTFAAEGHNPSVLLDDEPLRLDEPLYSFGHSEGEYAENGEGVLLHYEGPANDLLGRKMLKLREGNVRPGMSGAPLLNRRTGKVCGVVFSSRDIQNALGGRAIPSALLFPMSPELKIAHDSFHRANTMWSDLWNKREGAVRLMDFPRGPIVEQDRVGQALIRAIGNTYPTPTLAPTMVREANRLRRQADDDAGLIDFADIPPPTAAPFDYWFGVFLSACLQGPRMLAAILLVMDEWKFPESVQIDRRRLLDHLRLP
jgi:hypothetical protein